MVLCLSRDLAWHRNEILQAVDGYCLRVNYENEQNWIQERIRLEKQIKQFKSEPPIVIERFVEDHQKEIAKEKQKYSKYHKSSSHPPNAYVPATGKRGLGAPWDSIGSDLDQIPAGQRVSWYHNWESYKAQGGNQFEYVATLRTSHPDDIQRFQTNMPNNGAKSLICLNEPNEPSQANLSPEDAAQIWRRYCWPQKQRGVRLIAPAISNGQNGLPWLRTFMSLTRDVPPDVISAHWYGYDGYDMIRFVQSLRDNFGMPVWIPEFCHLNNNIYDQRGLQGQVRQWMDNQWWVERYAWFSCSRGDQNNINDSSRLLDRNGHMTDLMYKYVYDA